MTMTRRDFLSASAALAAAPAFGAGAWAAPLPREADIVVIGAGAAGIAAARRIMAANRKVIVVEAAGQIGGRCLTDVATFEVPFDRGARWMYNPDTNPMIRLARNAGLDISSASLGQKIRIGRRNARAGETEEFLAGLVRANRAIDEASRGRVDVSCASVLPKDLGVWAGAAEFVLGANAAGKDLKDISAIDKVRAQERNAAIALPPGPRHADCETGRAGPVVAVDACQPHRLERARRHGRDAFGQDRRARRGYHGVEQRVGRRQHQIRAGYPQAPARCRGKIEPRQLRPHRPAAAGQSVRARPRRHHHRAEQLDADGVAVCQHGIVVAVLDRYRRFVTAAISRRRASRPW